MAFEQITAGEVDPNSPGDQALMDKIRLNFDDHEARLNATNIAPSDVIRTHFLGTTLADGLVNEKSGGTQIMDFRLGTNGVHAVRLRDSSGGGVTTYNYLRAATNRCHFRLNQDMAVYMETRVREVNEGDDHTESCVFGFQDDALVGATTVLTDQSDCIGFVDGTELQWRFRTSKAGTASNTADLGARNTTRLLRVEALKSGATLQVRGFFDGVEVSGSPFSANVPDTVVLRPVMGYVPDIDATSFIIDYLDVVWTSLALPTLS